VRQPLRIFNNLSSSTLWSLITANLVVAALALRFDWSLIELLWIYWSQSVIIGAINFFKLLSLSQFSTEGFTMNGHAVPADQRTKITTALFFALHFGFFHFVYFIFLTTFTLAGSELNLSARSTNVWGVMLSAIIFLANHLYSFFVNWPQEKLETNIGQQMFIPYIRIIPMHLTIIFGLIIATSTNWRFAPILFFIILKSCSDIVMHQYEHRGVAKQ